MFSLSFLDQEIVPTGRHTMPCNSPVSSIVFVHGTRPPPLPQRRAQAFWAGPKGRPKKPSPKGLGFFGPAQRATWQAGQGLAAQKVNGCKGPAEVPIKSLQSSIHAVLAGLEGLRFMLSWQGWQGLDSCGPGMLLVDEHVGNVVWRLQSSIPAGLEAGVQQAADCRPGWLTEAG